MITTAQNWGESIGVRIPQHIAKKYNLVNGMKVEIFDAGKNIGVKPVQDKPTLEELIAKCNPEDRPEEIDFGGPVGRELI